MASIPFVHRGRDPDHDPEAGGQTNRAKASPLYAHIVTMGWVHQPASLTITAHSIALTQGYHVDSLVDAGHVANATYNRSGARAAHAITSLQLVDCVARG